MQFDIYRVSEKMNPKVLSKSILAVKQIEIFTKFYCCHNELQVFDVLRAFQFGHFISKFKSH